MTLMETEHADEDSRSISPIKTEEERIEEKAIMKEKSGYRSAASCLSEISPNVIEQSKEFLSCPNKSECKDPVDSNQRIVSHKKGGQGSNSEDPNQLRHCSRCCRAILERFYLGVGNNQFWHQDCLRCEQCQVALDSHKTCFVKNGRILCREDYKRLFGNSKSITNNCSRCQTPLDSSELVMRARKSIFHVSCFTCCECEKCLKPGDEVVIRELGKLFCMEHWIVSEKNGGTSSVKDYLEVNDKVEKLDEPMTKQLEKHSFLNSSDIKSSSNEIKEEHLEQTEIDDITTLLPVKNYSSSNSIVKIDSLAPFKSSELDEHESKTESSLILLTSGSKNTSLMDHAEKMDEMSSSLFLQLNNSKKSKSKKKKKKQNAEETLSQFSEVASGDELILSDNDSLTGMDILDTEGSSGHGKAGSASSQRQKRVRTSFKHHQLRTMKAYFSVNHNPDAKDLKQLSQKTGLSKRVLQVWFQNARAKFRRSLQKQQEIGPNGDLIGNGGGPGQGMLDANNQNGLQGLVPARRIDCNSYSNGTIHHDDQESPSLSEISSAPPSLTEFGSPNNLAVMQDSQHYHFVNNQMLYSNHVLPSHSSYLSHLGGGGGGGVGPPSQNLHGNHLAMNLMSQSSADLVHPGSMLPPHVDLPSQPTSSSSFFSSMTHGINCLG